MNDGNFPVFSYKLVQNLHFEDILKSKTCSIVFVSIFLLSVLLLNLLKNQNWFIKPFSEKVFSKVCEKQVTKSPIRDHS